VKGEKSTVSFFTLLMLAMTPSEGENRIGGTDIPVEGQRLLLHVKTLTEISPPRNYLNTGSLNEAARYVEERFAESGGRVSVQEFTVEDRAYRNIVASFGPQEGERVIVGAHYDVCGHQPGADDNASGVAGLLELARLLGRKGASPPHRVDLVAYSLEEPPFFGTKHMGSAVHAARLAREGVEVKGMLSLEMIGYFSEEKNSQSFPFWVMRFFYPTTADFVAVVGNRRSGDLIMNTRRFMTEAAGIGVETLRAPFFVVEAGFSDHRNYWKHGYQAAMVTDTSFFRSPHYHEETDTIETLDFGKMAEVVKGVYWTVLNL
jgi:Zn-dependent M28 family amino/carboxypeptidase